MSSKEWYKQQFLELWEIEKKARDLYKSYNGKIEDPFIAIKFDKIYHEEENHMLIVQDLINLVS